MADLFEQMNTGNVVNVTYVSASVYKYMGISFNSKLSWTKAKEKFALQDPKVNKRVQILSYKVWSFHRTRIL